MTGAGDVGRGVLTIPDSFHPVAPEMAATDVMTLRTVLADWLILRPRAAILRLKLGEDVGPTRRKYDKNASIRVGCS